MQKILAITTSTRLEKSLGDALPSPRQLARVSSWAEAHRLMSKTSPAAVLVGDDLATAAHVTEVVRLDNVLGKDGKTAYLVADDPTGPLAQWTEMFDTIQDVVATPKTPRQWRDLAELLQAHLVSSTNETKPSAATKSNRKPTKKGKPGRSAGSSESVTVVRLPQIKDGTLSSVPLGRICYSLSIRSSTGVLHLRAGKAQRNFAFSDGRFIEAPGLDDSEALTSAFAWPEGKFKFEPRQSISGTPKSIFALIMRGLQTYRPHRQIMQDLMPRLQTYPVATQFWSQRRDRLDWDILARVMDHCDGSQTLEQIFGKMGSAITEAFCSAVFSRDTDLLLFQSQPTPGPLKVQYDHDSKATTSKSSSSSGNSNKSDRTSKVARATGKERANLEKELRQFHTSLESMTAHQVFGLWEGCGRELVKETYYSMVKEHHPDVYGGNVSGDVRKLAQTIFVQIRQSYSELLKVEQEQTVPPPDPIDPSAKGRKRRKQVDTLHSKQGQPAVEKKKLRQPNRAQRMTSPIGLGRAPSEAHPEYTGDSAASPQKPKRTKTTPPKASTTSRTRRRTSSLGGKKSRRRTSSAGGIGEPTSDPEWRRQRLERLERSSSRTRRPTPISPSGGSIPAPKNKPKPAQSAFNSGFKKFKNNLYRKALADFQRAHEAEPENGLYKTFYAYCLFQVDPDQSKKCREMLKKVIDSNDRQALPDAHLFLGKILKVDGHPDRAYRHFKKALELNPAAREAEREIRLYEKRHGLDKKKSGGDGGLFKKLFKK
jgi:hypothetical protein